MSAKNIAMAKSFVDTGVYTLYPIRWIFAGAEPTTHPDWINVIVYLLHDMPHKLLFHTNLDLCYEELRDAGRHLWKLESRIDLRVTYHVGYNEVGDFLERLKCIEQKIGLESIWFMFDPHLEEKSIHDLRVLLDHYPDKCFLRFIYNRPPNQDMGWKYVLKQYPDLKPYVKPEGYIVTTNNKTTVSDFWELDHDGTKDRVKFLWCKCPYHSLYIAHDLKVYYCVRHKTEMSAPRWDIDPESPTHRLPQPEEWLQSKVKCLWSNCCGGLKYAKTRQV